MPIVAAVDRSNRAPAVIEEAGVLAAAFDTEVHAVSVLGRSEFFNLGRTAEGSGESVTVEDIKGVAADIAAEAAEGTDVAVTPVGLMGGEADRVVDYAREHDARYIVVGPRRRSPTGKALFGSVAQDILLHAECPVVSVIRR